MDITIRAANEGDLPALCALYEKMYAELGGFGLPFTLNMRALEEMLGAHIRSRLHAVYAAEAESGLAGFIAAGISKIERKFEAPPLIGTVLDLYVDVPFRNAGLATRLTGAAEAWFKSCGVDFIQLSVVHGNNPAHAFWAKRGYGDLNRVMYKTMQ